MGNNTLSEQWTGWGFRLLGLLAVLALIFGAGLPVVAATTGATDTSLRTKLLAGPVLSDMPDWTVYGDPDAYDGIGAWFGAGDINGDGYGDVLVSAAFRRGPTVCTWAGSTSSSARWPAWTQPRSGGLKAAPTAETTTAMWERAWPGRAMSTATATMTLLWQRVAGVMARRRRPGFCLPRLFERPGSNAELDGRKQPGSGLFWAT